MNSKKWMLEITCSKHIGKVAVFYIPINKLNKEVRHKFHNFFVEHYSAYTHEVSRIQGFWSKDNKIIKDKHERYEVSFKGKKNLKKFVEFLSEVCLLIKEHSIYMIIGDESYLITPQK